MAVETVRVEGLRGVLDAFKRFPVEMAKAGGPVKAGLRAGAQLLRDEAKANVRRIIDTPNDGGGDKSTGLLLLSIIAARSKMPASVKGERFIVRIRANQKYPEFRQDDSGTLTAVQIGRQLEYGTEHRDPMAWMRPAYDAKREAAMSVIVDVASKRTAALIKRIERESEGK
jgi:hypothetical protein